MGKTVAFVTNQYCCDRIIYAARTVADTTPTDLLVIGIMDAEYALDPEVVDYLFGLSKTYRATMRLIFSTDKIATMREIIADSEVERIFTGIPSTKHSVLHTLWEAFPNKQFYVVDTDGEMLEVEHGGQTRTA